MSKHTPGPWTAEKRKDRKIRGWVIRAPGNFPCISYELATLSGYDPIHDKPNARLIAAAPELLAALQLYLAHASEPECAIWRRVQQKARAAINKATGKQA